MPLGAGTGGGGGVVGLKAAHMFPEAFAAVTGGVTGNGATALLPRIKRMIKMMTIISTRAVKGVKGGL